MTHRLDLYTVNRSRGRGGRGGTSSFVRGGEGASTSRGVAGEQMTAGRRRLGWYTWADVVVLAYLSRKIAVRVFPYAQLILPTVQVDGLLGSHVLKVFHWLQESDA